MIKEPLLFITLWDNADLDSPLSNKKNIAINKVITIFNDWQLEHGDDELVYINNGRRAYRYIRQYMQTLTEKLEEGYLEDITIMLDFLRERGIVDSEEARP